MKEWLAPRLFRHSKVPDRSMIGIHRGLSYELLFTRRISDSRRGPCLIQGGRNDKN